ncbi:MAG: putative phage tail protein [Lachnospiraceae bacterium]|nr:putative phage tail protein [Lachnospiraceae bacterium]
MIDYLPLRYQEMPEVVDMEKALNIVASMVESQRDEILKQINLETATWGLSTWESEYGINVDITKTYAFRRSRIKSKMRGQGTTTIDMIKNVAESFVNGLVDIVEHNEENSFDVKMMSVKGIPPNMDDLITAVEEIKPAHLAYTIILLYNTHQYLKQFTHGQLSAFTHKQLREEDLS